MGTSVSPRDAGEPPAAREIDMMQEALAEFGTRAGRESPTCSPTCSFDDAPAPSSSQWLLRLVDKPRDFEHEARRKFSEIDADAERMGYAHAAVQQLLADGCDPSFEHRRSNSGWLTLMPPDGCELEDDESLVWRSEKAD